MLVSRAAPRSTLIVRSAPLFELSTPGFEFGAMPTACANVGDRLQPVAYGLVSAGMTGPTGVGEYGDGMNGAISCVP